MAGTASAQSASTAVPPPQLFWVSAGLGGGRLIDFGPLIDVHASATYSRGPWLLSGRIGGHLSEAEDTFYSTDEMTTSNWSALVGARSGTDWFFTTGAIGVGTARRSRLTRLCESCAASRETVRSFGAAYEVGGHIAASTIGVATHLFGLVGPHNVTFIAWSLSLEVGHIR